LYKFPLFEEDSKFPLFEEDSKFPLFEGVRGSF